MSSDERYMAMALGLAKRAEGMTSPNPLVGAVIVRGNKIVGKGYHKRCGLPHAEVNALRAAGEKAEGSTLYVTLEPCDHHGRTPPCTEAIIGSGIRRVVIAMKDPNPVTDGRGIRKLKAHGIRTDVGVLKEEAAAMNRPFIKSVTKKMPFVRIKMAESIDGKIATVRGDSKWITGEKSRLFVHRLRRMADAVMVGSGTAIKDDPSLLCKIPGDKQPVRIVVDSALKLPISSKLVSTAVRHSVIIATTGKADFKKAEMLARRGVSILFCKARGQRVDLTDLLKKLSRLGISDLLVEGGGELAASLIEDRLADRILFFISPMIVGGRDAKTSVEGRGVKNIRDAIRLKNISIRRFDDDTLIEAEVA